MAEWWDLQGYPGGTVGAGASALGAGADIFSFVRNEQSRQALERIRNILSNPQQLSRYIGKLYQPMSAAENTAVQRDLGANWSVMTGGAPGGAMNQYVADALAKIESQRYGDTANRAIQSLSGAAGVSTPNLPGGNLGNILRSLMILKRIRGDQQTPGLTLGDVPGISLSDTVRSQGPGVYPAPVAELEGV